MFVDVCCSRDTKMVAPDQKKSTCYDGEREGIDIDRIAKECRREERKLERKKQNRVKAWKY